ncbi:putative ribonuclease H protein [Nymphaea thermarum]|nr:putative ribonuclease H protein [Nymphaea thermarum]
MVTPMASDAEILDGDVGAYSLQGQVSSPVKKGALHIPGFPSPPSPGSGMEVTPMASDAEFHPLQRQISSPVEKGALRIPGFPSPSSPGSCMEHGCERSWASLVNGRHSAGSLTEHPLEVELHDGRLKILIPQEAYEEMNRPFQWAALARLQGSSPNGRTNFSFVFLELTRLWAGKANPKFTMLTGGYAVSTLIRPIDAPSEIPPIQGLIPMRRPKNQFTALMELDDTNEDPMKSSFTIKVVSSPQDRTSRGSVQPSSQTPRHDTTTRRAKGKGIMRDVTENQTSMGVSLIAAEVGSRMAGRRKSAQDTANHSFADPKPLRPAGKRKRVSLCRVEGSSEIDPPSQTNDVSTSGGEVRVIKKLEFTRSSLSNWARSCVDDISLRIKAVREELDKVQSLGMTSTVNDINYEKLLHEELQASLEEEDNLWRQRAQVKWLAEGDRNTAYYQAIVKSHQTKNSLSALEHEGRLCLIRYVLFSLIGYWCSVFILPKSIQHKLEATMANFLWRSQATRKGDEAPWASFIRKKYLSFHSLWTLKCPKKESWFFKGVRKNWVHIHHQVRWSVGIGAIRFWTDNWGGSPLIAHLNPLERFAFDFFMKFSIKQVIDSDLPILHNFKHFLSRVEMERPNLHSQKDLLLWQNTPASNIKTTDVWEVVRQKYDEEPWRKLIWPPHTQPRAQWFVWLACNDRLPTFDRQKKSDISLANRCALCFKDEESAHHVMVSCPHSSKIWGFITFKFKRSYNPQHTIVRELKCWFSCSFKRGWLMKYWNVCFHIILESIWCIRNSRIHKDDTSSPQQDSYVVWRVCVDGFYAIMRSTGEDRRDLQVWLNTGIVPYKCPRIVTGQACLQVASVTSNGRQLVMFMLKDSDGLHRDQGVAWSRLLLLPTLAALASLTQLTLFLNPRVAHARLRVFPQNQSIAAT